jgi:hypothetical protein
MESHTQSESMDEVKQPPQNPFAVDIEEAAMADCHLENNTVKNFSWQHVTVTVKDHKTGHPKAILNDVDGAVQAGILRRSALGDSVLT